MTGLLLRARRAATGVGLSATVLAFVMAAAGCALFEEPRHARTKPGAGALRTASIKPASPRVARATSRPKVAAVERQESRKESPQERPMAAPKAPPPTRPAQLAEETACVSVDQCASVLKAMVEDTGRAWVNWPASARTLANGVRLFAYRSLRPKLTCRELTTALHELTIAMAAFAGPVSGLEQGEIDRARELTAEVEGELKTERVARCGNATGQALDIPRGALPAADPKGRPATAVR
jgi:hypothetical protein